MGSSYKLQTASGQTVAFNSHKETSTCTTRGRMLSSGFAHTLSSNKTYMSSSFPIHSCNLFAYLMEFYSYVFKCTSLPFLRGDLANSILLIACYCTPGSLFLICIAYLYLWTRWLSTQTDSCLLKCEKVKFSPKRVIEWLSLIWGRERWS